MAAGGEALQILIRHAGGARCDWQAITADASIAQVVNLLIRDNRLRGFADVETGVVNAWSVVNGHWRVDCSIALP
jgi:hypothetical protein